MHTSQAAIGWVDPLELSPCFSDRAAALHLRCALEWMFRRWARSGRFVDLRPSPIKEFLFYDHPSGYDRAYPP